MPLQMKDYNMIKIEEISSNKMSIFHLFLKDFPKMGRASNTILGIIHYSALHHEYVYKMNNHDQRLLDEYGMRLLLEIIDFLNQLNFKRTLLLERKK